MYLRGNYNNGFAPRDGDPEYPSLWEGCVGAWAAFLGQTAGTVLDWSGRCNHATITNMEMTDWVVHDDGMSLTLDGVDEFLDCGTPSAFSFEYTQPFSMSIWARHSDTSQDSLMAKQTGDGALFRGYSLGLNNASIDFTIISNLGTGNYLYGTGSAPGASNGAWHHFGVTYSGNASTSGMTIYYDRLSVAVTSITNALSGTIVDSGTSLRIGGRGLNNIPWAGSVDDARLYDRVLSAYEMKLLGTRRAIAYELRHTKRVSVDDAALIYYNQLRSSTLSRRSPFRQRPSVLARR